MLRLEIARTDAELRRGLSGRRLLGPDDGMLFVFTTDRIEPFWNVGTHVPLSLAFLSADGRVLGLRDMLTIEESGGRPVEYHPRTPYRYALEVPRGWFARHRVRVGACFDLVQSMR